MIDDIIQRLYADSTRDTLYHYTNLQGLQGVVDSGVLRASDVRYMNDSTELRHTLELMQQHISQRLQAGTDHPALLNALQEWLSHRIVGGPMLFAASFRANGNLLGQWRGYSALGKGVSLGFAPDWLREKADAQGFQIARCIYHPGTQENLVEEIVDAVEDDAQRALESRGDLDEAVIFERLESRLLRIAAVLKHPAFEEEQEWRLVSPVMDDCQDCPVAFREGVSMLIPWYPFRLGTNETDPMRLEHVFLGPTPNTDLSMNSLALYLRKRGVEPRRGVEYCRIPYRQR